MLQLEDGMPPAADETLGANVHLALAVSLRRKLAVLWRSHRKRAASEGSVGKPTAEAEASTHISSQGYGLTRACGGFAGGGLDASPRKEAFPSNGDAETGLDGSARIMIRDKAMRHGKHSIDAAIGGGSPSFDSRLKKRRRLHLDLSPQLVFLSERVSANTLAVDALTLAASRLGWPSPRVEFDYGCARGRGADLRRTILVWHEGISSFGGSETADDDAMVVENLIFGLAASLDDKSTLPLILPRGIMPAHRKASSVFDAADLANASCSGVSSSTDSDPSEAPCAGPLGAGAPQQRSQCPQRQRKWGRDRGWSL
eukprot:TRINITY_DN15906_c0_g1_i2.p1 TRINITY_DN15906_c0_g1~~TRINITY_DN15906_c0_g1_i2.p1  ORF type:complete len:361 (-),score=43.06 TRINITY_DN15906_c0_g1_i2:15-956(-)